MTSASADLLNLVVRSRSEKVRWDLLDSTGRVIGELHPEYGATLQNDATAQIKRKVTGFKLPSSEFASVNPLSDRVRPWWVLDNGDEFPCGVFLWADAQTTIHSYGSRIAGTLVDQGLILGQEIDSTVGFDAGASATTAIAQTLERAGFFDVDITVGTFELGSPVAWPAGKSGTTWASIVDDLCGKAGAYPAYFDNSGVPIIRPVADVDAMTATLDYTDAYARTVAASIVESNDLLIAPNRFLAIDTSATDAPITAVYDIPDSAPHSYANRGFRITKVVESPGVGDVAQALAAAQAAYTSAPQAYATAAWASPPDPRHDTFDVIRFRGQNWLETGWTLPCTAGATMTHQASRVFL